MGLIVVGILLTGSCLGHGHTLEERAKAGGLGRKLAGPTLVGVGVIITLLRYQFPCISFYGTLLAKGLQFCDICNNFSSWQLWI